MPNSLVKEHKAHISTLRYELARREQYKHIQVKKNVKLTIVSLKAILTKTLGYVTILVIL